MTVLGEEVLGEITTQQVEIRTPTSPFSGVELDVDDLCCVSIIRAGDSLLDCMRALLPGVSVGKILIQRDESVAHKPAIMMYEKLPKDIQNKFVILCDPMLATGGSAHKAIECLLKAGVPENKIVFANVICCPEGIEYLGKVHPLMKIITACIDDGMNEDKYIVPGLGDYGDRYFNTTGPSC